VLINAPLIVLQIASALLLILFILLHAGRGGGLSDMLGGAGGAQAGATVVEKNLDRITVITALVFLFSTVILGLRLD
jgi:preprotein translocase subunit SecG